MIVGILSDTHDQYDRMGRAVRTLKERGAEFFIHCGDVCQPRLLDHLAGLPSAFVWGNCDWDRMAHVLNAQEHDYLLHGHTHVRRDERVGKVRIINPGALHRAREKTVAVLDTDTDRLTFVRVVA